MSESLTTIPQQVSISNSNTAAKDNKFEMIFSIAVVLGGLVALLICAFDINICDALTLALKQAPIIKQPLMFLFGIISLSGVVNFLVMKKRHV